MHMVGKYSRDKEHKARILADNLDKQDAGDKVDKVDTPAFEVGTPAADRVGKRGETAAPRSGERAAHLSHVRGARTAHCQHFVPSPGHYPPPQFDCCQRAAFRECWIVRGVVEYPPGLFPRVPIAPRLAADYAPQSLAPGRYIQNSLSLSLLPIQGRCWHPYQLAYVIIARTRGIINLSEYRWVRLTYDLRLDHTLTKHFF